MRKKIWGTALLTLGTVIALSSCSDSDSDSDNNNQNNNQNTTVYSNPKEYVGIWTLESATAVNGDQDSTIYYNGDYITIINDNKYGAMQDGTFFEWKVDTATNRFWFRPGTYWLATWTTNRITADEWDFTERVTSTASLIHHNRKITTPNPEWYVGTWNIQKVQKIQKNGIDTLLSDWAGSTDVTTTEITNGLYWYEKSITFKADGTMKNFDGSDMNWLVAGPNIWGYNTSNINVDNTEWTKMIQCKEQVANDELVFVIKILNSETNTYNRAYRFTLTK